MHLDERGIGEHLNAVDNHMELWMSRWCIIMQFMWQLWRCSVVVTTPKPNKKWYEIHPSHIEDDERLADDNRIRTNE